MWLLNSGASQHIANNPQAFSGLKPAMQMWVILADGQRAAVKGEGNVYVPEIGDTLYNVLYVPALEHNLLSISKLDRQGYEILFAGGQYTFTKNGQIHARGVKKDGLYKRRPVTKTQKHIIPRRSERSNKGIPSERFTVSEVRVYSV
ncbi:hypothetical protein E2320_001414, partial [Naja naja]